MIRPDLISSGGCTWHGFVPLSSIDAPSSAAPALGTAHRRGQRAAHWFAATIAIQLVRDKHANHSTAEYLTAHLLIPSVAAISASLAVIIAPNDVKLLAGRLTAAALLALLVAGESRRTGTSPARSIRIALLAFGCAAGIAFLKRLFF